MSGWKTILARSDKTQLTGTNVTVLRPKSLDELAQVADAARRAAMVAQSELEQLDEHYKEARRMQVEHLEKLEAEYADTLQACINANYERGIGSDMFKRELERIKSGKETP